MTIYLYVKQHSITGLKYFGKTTKPDPFKYMGSGDYWVNHIKKYGREHVRTTQLWGFDNQQLCTEFALAFSENNDIVKSKDWANLVPENGLDGAPKGRIVSEEQRKKLTGLKRSDESKKKMSAAQSGRKLSEEHRKRISAAGIGRKWSEETRKKITDTKCSDECHKRMSAAQSGRIHSEETKKKIRAAHIGRKHSEEHRKNNRAAQIGRKASEETKTKMRAAAAARFKKDLSQCIF